MNVGLRYDHYSIFGGTTNPRGALIYDPWRKTTFKFLYGQSFRPPNQFELYYDAPGNEANPSLLPQTVKTMELVWEQYFSKHFRMAVSGFYYPIHGLISEQVDPANGNAFFANSGSMGLRGFDFALSRRLPGGLQGTASYSFQDVSDSAHTAVPNAPKHVVQTALSAPLIRQKIFASMDLQFVSARGTLAGPNTGAYVVPNFTVFMRNVFERWELSASIYNAFNRIYADPVGNGLAENVVFQDGRTFRIKVGYKLR